MITKPLTKCAFALNGDCNNYGRTGNTNFGKNWPHRLLPMVTDRVNSPLLCPLPTAGGGRQGVSPMFRFSSATMYFPYFDSAGFPLLSQHPEARCLVYSYISPGPAVK